MNKVCVFGAGAVGSHMAAWLARGGLELSVLARGAALQAIRQDGLRFESAEATFTVHPPVTDQPAELGPQDLVIVALKANALPDAVDALRPLLGPDTPVVFAVNGIPWWYAPGALPRLDPQQRLQQEIGVQRAIGCVISSPNTLLAPGVVHNASASNRFLLGEPGGGASGRVRACVQMLQGLPGVEPTESIRSAIWSKLLVNVPESTLSVLTLSDAADYIPDPRLHALYVAMAQETCGVAAAEGFDVLGELPGRLAVAGKFRHTPSMLQDLRKGRSLESDAQLHAVQALARRSGVATPLLDTLLPLLEQRALTGRC